MHATCDTCSTYSRVTIEDGQAICWPCLVWTSDDPTVEAVALAAIAPARRSA